MKTPAKLDAAHETEWVERSLEAPGLVDTSTLEVAAPGKGIFLAHAFSGLLDGDGKIIAEARQRLTVLMDGLRAHDHAVHCALEREDWGNKLMSPAGALKIDEDQVGKAGCLVSFPQGSPGAFLELGMRIAVAKPAVIVETVSGPGNNEAIAEEERAFMSLALVALEDAGVACLRIEDSSTDMASFEAGVITPVVGWVDRHI